MTSKKQLFTARVHTPQHKGMTSTRGFLKPVHGKFRKNLEFHADQFLDTNDLVEYYMEKGEPIVTRKLKKQ